MWLKTSPAPLNSKHLHWCYACQRALRQLNQRTCPHPEYNLALIQAHACSMMKMHAC